jgi:TonB family protein
MFSTRVCAGLISVRLIRAALTRRPPVEMPPRPSAPDAIAVALAAVVALLPGASHAQVVGGIARDRATRAPLRAVPAALLADTGVVATARTDSTGTFYLSAPAAGVYRVRFAVDATETFVSDTLTLTGDAFLQREFLLEIPRERVYFEFQVAKPVVPARGNAGPRYPEELKRSNIEGVVIAQFIVDTTGRVRPGSFKVLQSSHPLFVESVRASLVTARYEPAEIGGRKVPQVVQQPFHFQLTF